MYDFNDFRKYAIYHRGMTSMVFDQMFSVTKMPFISDVAPYVIEEGKGSHNIYSLLLKERIIFMTYPVDDYVASGMQAQLLWLQSQEADRDISMYINSPGGSVSAGLGIYDTMQFINPDVSTICIGMAASMGAVLLAAGAAGKRYALPNSRVMIHQPLGGASGQASDIEITAREINKVKKNLYEILCHHTGKEYAQIEKDSDRDYWMTAPEAQEYGLIDKVITYNKK